MADLSPQYEAEILQYSERPGTAELAPPRGEFINDGSPAHGINLRDPDTLASAARSTTRAASFRDEILKYQLG